MNDDKDKILNEYIKKISDALNDGIGNNYIFNNNTQATYLREYVDNYALSYYKSTGDDVLAIGELLEDGQMDFKLFVNPNK